MSIVGIICQSQPYFFSLSPHLLFQNFTLPNTSCMAITSDHYNSINANQPSKTVQNNAIPCITNVVWNHFRQKGFNCFTFKRFSRISLLDLDLEAFLFHFSLLEKSEPDLDFAFHFSVKVKKIFFSLSILEKSEANFHFTFHFSVGVKEILISLFTSRNSNIYSRRTLIASLRSTPDESDNEKWKNVLLICMSFVFDLICSVFQVLLSEYFSYLGREVWFFSPWGWGQQR